MTGLMKGGWATIAVCLAASGLAGIGLASDTPASTGDSETIYLDSSPGDDWPGAGRTYGEQHFSPLEAIDEQTIDRLGLVWSLDLDSGYSVTQPIAVDERLYFTTGLGILHAVDATSGKRLWSYDPQAWDTESSRLRASWGSRGVAWWNGRIYMGTLDGRLIAVDAATGEPVWSVQTTEGDDGRFISGAPRIFDGKVIIGHGGADGSPLRGYVTTYDAETGEQLWRFYTVPGNPADGFENEAMEMAAKTWHGEWWKYGGGGNAWNAMSYDPETNTVLIGTGNGSPWNHKVRSEGKGDNLFLCSILALDADTGEYKWHYQINPGETWDYNAAMDIEFADLEIDGKLRKVLMTAPKNGFLYVIDRTDGELISAEPYVPVTWAERIDLKTGRPVEAENARFENGKFYMEPGPVGAHSWLPMAFSPKTGLVYIPTIEMGFVMFDTFDKAEEWKRASFYGVDGAVATEEDKSSRKASSLVAIDPVTHKEVWRVPTPTVVGGGLLATAGNLVFQGTFDNRFTAYDGRTGEALWTFDTKAPTIGPPISYTVDGKQYISVITGSGGSLVLMGDAFDDYAAGYHQQARRVLTFALDGKATLPDSPKYELKPIDDPEYVSRPAVEERGLGLYTGTCIMCHGRDGYGQGGAAPDLRESPLLLSEDAFASVVRDGALRQQGMPPFKDLTPRMVEDIRQFLRKQAREAAKGG